MTIEKAVPRNKRINKDYLSVDTSKIVKGILIFMIFLSHARGKIDELNNTILGQIITSFGYLAVAMFMFYTGYGLKYSVMSKGQDYIRLMPRKRIMPFYVHCLIVVGVYVAYNRFIFKEHVDASRILQSITLGDTVVEYGWYLHAILLIYVLFFLICRFVGKPKSGMMVHLVLIALYVIICVLLNSNTIYYEFLLAFFLTTIWYDQKVKIDKYCSERWLVCIGGTTLLFIVTLLMGNMMTSWGAVAFGIKMLSAMFFCAIVLMMLMKIKLPKNPLIWLGDRSLEIYVSQGIILKLFRSQHFYIQNPMLYTVICMGLTLLIAGLLHLIFRKLDTMIDRVWVKK